MKRWLAKLTIASYLTALTMGIVCHAMDFGLSVHPSVYYFVWDMFCGWSAHEVRYHVIGEGESGAFYQLSPAPWNTFAPYGDLERGQYDTIGNAHARIAMNTLDHTEHEPITRILIFEEVWSKKYNLPDHLWALRFDEPKDPHSYFWHKSTLDANGNLLEYHYDYISNLQSQAVNDNPRLKADSQRGKPFFAVSPFHRNSAAAGDGGYGTGSAWGVSLENDESRPSAN